MSPSPGTGAPEAIKVDASPPPHHQALIALTSAHGITARIVTPGAPMPTVAAAAAALGVDPEQILKSLLFIAPGGETVLAVASGHNRVNKARLATAAGFPRLVLAPAAVVRQHTGFPVGGVAPIGHASPLPVVIDDRAMALRVAYGGAGDEQSLLEIRPLDIRRLTNGVTADFTDPPSA